MKYIYGIYFLNADHADKHIIRSTLDQMAGSYKQGSVVWNDGRCGIGRCEKNDVVAGMDLCVNTNGPGNTPFTSVARLDNREELIHALGVSPEESLTTSDSALIWLAYQKWGDRCTERLYGDWSFVVWHPEERTLFLARDHYGITSLFFYADSHLFAFATSRKSLLALKLASTGLNELFLAQILTMGIPDGFQTINTHIQRLPPAHRLTVTPDKLDIYRYWYLEKTPLLRLPRREDYVAAFSELFADAVKVRLQLADVPYGRLGNIASTLSGGLDSSSVTALAATYVSRRGQRVKAYTSVPLYDTTPYINNNSFGDEFPLARATAEAAGNVDLTAINGAGCSPIQAIRQMLEITNEPCLAAGNLFWMLELWQTAQADGNDILLLGQFGNAGVSWTGDVFSQSLVYQLRRMGWKKWMKQLLIRTLSADVRSRWQRYRINPEQFYRKSAINPAFAEKIQLLDQRFNDPHEQYLRAILGPRSFVEPVRDFAGALHAELGAAFGLDVRDPTADARLLAFTFSVPDKIFIDPETGMGRWLIREAMKGILPDAVRLNRKYGRQARDLVPRLRACSVEVEAALGELARGPAAIYVDVPYMCQVWQMVQVEDKLSAYINASSILTCGIMAGLFVNDFYK